MSGTQNETESINRDQILVIEKVTKDSKKPYKNLKPIANYAAEKLRDLGIEQTPVLFAKDNTKMISYLREGKVDWVTETLFSAVFYREKARAEILLRKWRKGAPEYYTVFFTQKGSGIDALEDLKGKMIAFEDPGSITAFYVPASVLISEVIRSPFFMA